MTFAAMWAELAAIGRDPTTGGYRRAGWTPAERAAQAWFLDQCSRRGLSVESDAIGNVVAWWRPDPGRRDPGVVTGSHLDSVPDGGAFDGPLGVVSGLAAVDRLRGDGFVPARPIGIAVFVEEEGSRFGLPCLGSRVATGQIGGDRVLALRDRDGVGLVAAAEEVGHGLDPDELGPSDLPALLDPFVELHVEQGRWLADGTAAVGVATGIWPHGRWRLELSGRADHAGTTRMGDRADPMLTAAFAALSANKQARLAEARTDPPGGARATVGRVEPVPNATNAVPAAVRLWLDARAEHQPALDALVATVVAQVEDRAARDGTQLSVARESASPAVTFDPELRGRLARVVGAALGGDGPAPVLPTAAGHDAGVLAAAGVPTAMLFVRNPTGVSHSPAEHAEPDDCAAGVEALAAVLADLAGSALAGGAA
jgi:N-carbamoyl-L-amino-acid hydrolase